MDLVVFGRHALLFDDDAMAVFVNSSDALLRWNSLLIDRYDVRHLLQQVPPTKKRLTQPVVEPDGVSCVGLDQERYLDLPPDEEGDVDSASEKPGSSAAVSIYQAVGFSYDNMGPSGDNEKSGFSITFHPPFPVPESLQTCLPPSEKVHQIIARTAKFVSEHGGQSEIVLRVKQGDNPTFGFLMPDHHLHPYFRFLVDHQELLKPETSMKPKEEKSQGGALSLLGSIYGEDDDGTEEAVEKGKEIATGEAADVGNETLLGSAEFGTSTSFGEKERAVPKLLSASISSKHASCKRKSSVSSVSTSGKDAVKNREAALSRPVAVPLNKQQPSPVSSTSEVELIVLEPPSSIKRTVDRIIEFILRNGKESHAILVEQDSTSEKFPFLLPHDQYHPYYLKTLQKAQEAKHPKKTSVQKQEPQESIKGLAGRYLNMENQLEGLYNTQRKEKFKMVFGGSKKGSQEPQSKVVEQNYGVSADEAAAIVMAATRGLRNPKSDTRPTTSNDSAAGLGGWVPTSSFGSVSFTYQPSSSVSKPAFNGEVPIDLAKSSGQSERSDNKTSDVSIANAMAKSAALAAASEADSSEAGMSKEQKQKAERLKRAKMFAALIRSGIHAPGSLPQTSTTAGDSAFSGCNSASNHSGGGLLNAVEREREGSSAPVDASKDTLEKCKDRDDDSNRNRRSRRKHSLRSRTRDDDSEEDYDRSSRKRYRSESSSYRGSDHHKHRKSRRELKHHHKHYSSSEDEQQHKSRVHKDRRRAHTEKQSGIEKDSKRLPGSSMINEANQNASKESSHVPSKGSDVSEVPEDLRAKVRAMLVATL